MPHFHTFAALGAVLGAMGAFISHRPSTARNRARARVEEREHTRVQDLAFHGVPALQALITAKKECLQTYSDEIGDEMLRLGEEIRKLVVKMLSNTMGAHQGQLKANKDKLNHRFDIFYDYQVEVHSLVTEWTSLKGKPDVSEDVVIALGDQTSKLLATIEVFKSS